MAAPGRKGTAKLSEIQEIEKEIQAKWERERTFENDAPEDKR